VAERRGVTKRSGGATPRLEQLLAAAGRDPEAQASRVEAELWRRNARFRAWTSLLPVLGRWSRSEAGFALEITCAACKKSRREERDRLSTLVKNVAAVFTLVERLALAHLERAGCEHGQPLLGADPEDILAITEIELVVGG
jgi:hypothetical protein